MPRKPPSGIQPLKNPKIAASFKAGGFYMNSAVLTWDGSRNIHFGDCNPGDDSHSFMCEAASA
jgi:hypothetical protein